MSMSKTLTHCAPGSSTLSVTFTTSRIILGCLAWWPSTIAQKTLTLKIIHAAVACGAKVVVLPECGHAYTALRWMGANMYGKPLPFKVMHIAEFLAEQVRADLERWRRVVRDAKIPTE